MGVDSRMADSPDASRIEQARTTVAGLAERYRRTVADPLLVLDRAADAMAGGGIDDGLRREAEREAHKLTGSAGTFGFDRASDLARELEGVFAAPTPDQGAQARELLDALRVELAAPATAPAAPSRDQPALLIVDSDAGLARRLAAEAAARGLRAEIAAGVQEAREAVDRRRPDVALLGFSPGRVAEALGLLGQLGILRPPVPTLVWTNGEGLTDRVEMARLGARGFLPRTSPLPQVLEAVTDLLDRQRSREHTVLAVDDDPMVLDMLRALLETEGMRIIALGDPAAFWDAVEQTAPDLVILDVDMPGVDGIELCRVLRNDRRWAQLPVLFLTARTDRATIQRVFASGADDFVAKPIVGPELMTRITNRLERVQLFRSLAETDGLTGVANRRRSTQVLEHFLGLASRFDQPLSLAMLDLDHFKRVNDRFGHATGDGVLQSLGSLLAQCFRGEDVVARWGGEEFLVGMYGMDRLDGVHRLADCLERLREEPFGGPEDELHVTFSAGVAQYPDDGADLPALYRAADQALYRAKRAGRNRVLPAGRHGRAAGRVDVAIVDDDEALAGLLLDGLATRGHSARWFRDGAVAAAALAGPAREVTARVLLLDEDLPGLDGQAVLRRLADAGVLAGSRVIVLTATRDVVSARTALAEGAFDHVVKPVRVPALMRRIRLALRATPTGPT